MADRSRTATPVADSSTDRRAFDTYVAEDYVQHNAGLTDGRAAVPVAALVDLYRADGNRIVEHWDVILPWPVAAATDHPMF